MADPQTAADGPRCARHPDAPAVEVCHRCGGFVCADCLHVKPNGAYCPSCAARFLSNIAGSWLAIFSAGLGFIGLGCAPLGPVAVILALIDLARMAHTGKRIGWKLDLAGIALGAVGILIWATILYRFLSGARPDFGSD
jgi:hypothetical protein